MYKTYFENYNIAKKCRKRIRQIFHFYPSLAISSFNVSVKGMNSIVEEIRLNPKKVSVRQYIVINLHYILINKYKTQYGEA